MAMLRRFMVFFARRYDEPIRLGESGSFRWFGIASAFMPFDLSVKAGDVKYDADPPVFLLSRGIPNPHSIDGRASTRKIRPTPEQPALGGDKLDGVVSRPLRHPPRIGAAIPPKRNEQPHSTAIMPSPPR